MERDFVDSQDYSELEMSKVQDELNKLRDRYDRYVCTEQNAVVKKIDLVFIV